MDDRPRRDRPQGVREALLAEAVALSAQHGPEGVSLREVQRRVGVSPAAAYKHYRDREALLVAVGQRASGLLSDTIEAAMSKANGEDGANARFRSGCRAYVEFALTSPGLFRCILLTGETIEQIAHPQPPSTGQAGLGPFELLLSALADLPAATPEDGPLVWAACHGLAVLLLDGPLRHLDTAGRDTLIEHELDLLATGLATPAAARKNQSERN